MTGLVCGRRPAGGRTGLVCGRRPAGGLTGLVCGRRPAGGLTGWQLCAGALLGLSVWTSCGEKAEGKKADVQRGRAVYMTTCINCHNPDPKKDGSVGPAVWGAPWALLRARVVKGEYPPGYVPKRKTRLMMPLPHLEKDILALHAFLNQ